MDIFELLDFTQAQGASDLHISSNATPMVRIHGKMIKLNLPVLQPEDVKRLVYQLLTEFQVKRLEENLEIDFSAKLEDKARYRVNVFQQINGLAAAFRVIPSEIKAFDELGLPESLKSLALKDRGFVLCTGPTGSGKSTTLATMIDYINDNQQKHIITIEDPIEFLHTSKSSLINQRELGHSTHTIMNALRSSLREDPDVILVGEMRDLETVSLALTAAETGHLVFATLHTSSASKTIDRMIDMFPKEQQAQVRSMLSESLEGIVAQKLLPLKSGDGRCVAVEVLVANDAVRNLIREEKTYQIPSVIQSGSKEGMITLDQSLFNLVSTGKIERSVAAMVAENPKMFSSGAGY